MSDGGVEVDHEDTDMNGRMILLTGASSGIGKETAVRLSRMGASLVIVCRNKERGGKALRDISQRSGNRDVELIVADFEQLRMVRKAAAEFIETHSRLDVLINNAGTNVPRYDETADGIEKTMAVNYFAPFLLTNLMIPVLEKSAPSRIVNVSSASHFSADIDPFNLKHDTRGGMFGLHAYARSKLALTLFTYELARRLGGKGVTANCLHPGAVRTHIWWHAGAVSPLSLLVSLFLKGPARGAETSVYLAASAEVEGVSGKYFVRRETRKSSGKTYDEGLARVLWERSVEICGLSEG